MQRLFIRTSVIFASLLVLACSPLKVGYQSATQSLADGHRTYQASWDGNIVEIQDERDADGSGITHIIDVHREGAPSYVSVGGVSSSTSSWHACLWNSDDLLDDHSCAKLGNPAENARATALLEKAFLAVHKPLFLVRDS